MALIICSACKGAMKKMNLGWMALVDCEACKGVGKVLKEEEKLEDVQSEEPKPEVIEESIAKFEKPKVKEESKEKTDGKKKG